MKESAIVITENGNKKKILRLLSKSKKLYNLKFYSFSELKKKIFFDYDNKTLEYVMKNYNVSLSIAKIYITNLYFLKDILDSKVKFLNNLKSDLENKELLVVDNNFRKWISNKNLVVYGYRELTKEQELILRELDKPYELQNDNSKHYEPVVYEAKSLDEEVEFVAISISKLLNTGIDISKIKIIINNDYENAVLRYFRIYNIPINMESTNYFYSTMVAQEFLNNYDNYSILDNIDYLREKYSNVNDLVNIINKSVIVQDKILRKEFIIDDLKNTKIKTKQYDKAVQVCNLDEINDEDYAFLLGFNINFYPQVWRDEEYLNDNIKDKLGLDTSSSKNILTKNKIIEKIQSIPNLVITYKLSGSRGVFYPSLLIKEKNLEVQNIDIDRSISYSRLNSKIKYAIDLDNFYKFNVVSDNLGLYRKSLNILYREFDNSFKGINRDLFKEELGGELTLAYTNMEMYNECAFKYYLSKILKVDIYEESFKIIIGNITHHILELGIKKDIDINVEIIKFIKEKDYELTKREYFYLEKLSEELKNILVIIREQAKHSKLNKYLFENEFYVYKDRDDINIAFKGLIDKVMYQEIEGKEVIAVVDYKTGNTPITLNNLEYGLNIQLPIYLYLLKKSDRFRDAIIGGFYIQKVLDTIPNILDNKSLEDQKSEGMRLQGYSNSDNNILELIDDEYLDSKIIKGLRFKANGEFYSSAKVLSSKEMDELTLVVDAKIEECISNILSAKFEINPKVINNKNISCTYCKFRDICFKCKKDEVMLGDDMDELDEGTGTSN